MPNEILKLMSLLQAGAFDAAAAYASQLEQTRSTLFADYDLVRFAAGISRPVNAALLPDLARQASSLIEEMIQAEGVPKGMPT